MLAATWQPFCLDLNGLIIYSLHWLMIYHCIFLDVESCKKGDLLFIKFRRKEHPQIYDNFFSSLSESESVSDLLRNTCMGCMKFSLTLIFTACLNYYNCCILILK